MRTAWVARRVAGMAGRRLLREARPDADALRGRMRVDPDWRRLDDGRAARLGPARTIEVTRKRTWRAHDPLRVEPGWWAPWQALGFGMWAGVVGLAWWQGSRHGRGPLADLHEPWEPWDSWGSES
jgi:hypothetical protein